jgi:NAD-dependent dihydropyrimidine dehydrogenase PreA subunit
MLARADAMTDESLCHETGMVWPVINPDRCFGDADCVSACPHGVLGTRAVSSGLQDAAMGRARAAPDLVISRQALVLAPERCAACGLCVAACGQRAIFLQGRYEARRTFV